MNNHESPINTSSESIDEDIWKLIKSFPYQDLGALREYVQLPSNASYEAISDFISRNGGGFVNTIIQEIRKARDRIGISNEQLEQALLQTLNRLKI